MLPMSRIIVISAAAVLLPQVAACEESTRDGSPPQTVSTPTDRITLPPPRREFVASSGHYVLVVSTRDNWKSARGTGELFSVAGSARTLIWTRELPQELGPRFALVNDAGTVLLLDQWINVSTKYAVLILDRDNRMVAQHSTEDVRAALQVPMNEVTRMAKHGWWISAPPTLTPAGDFGRVEAAGKLLTIRLSDGHLSIS
jgi:hypothetical protein